MTLPVSQSQLTHFNKEPKIAFLGFLEGDFLH